MAKIYSIKLKTQSSMGGRHLTIDESSVAPVSRPHMARPIGIGTNIIVGNRGRLGEEG